MQDYVPSGNNLCQGRNLTDAEANITTSGIGHQYTKARYLPYTDDTFTTMQVSIRNILWQGAQGSRLPSLR